MRALLRIGGTVAIVTGLATVLLGHRVIPGADAPGAGVASELRFFSAWWVAAGGFLWWLAPRVEQETLLLRGFCAALFLSGLARALGLAVDGRPPTLFVVLMVVELVLPPVLVIWQARTAG